MVHFFSCRTGEEKTSYLNHDPSVNYVGMQACAGCHADKVSTFVHTGMGMSFDSASRTKSSAHFSPHTVIHDSSSGFSYHPFWKGDYLYIREFMLSGEDTTYKQDVQVDFIVGSGQHTNSHLFEVNGYVFQAPITYYVQEGKWDLAPGFEKGNNARFDRMLNTECISCHNAMPKTQVNSSYKFTSIGSGIDCERCHGPGELHVKERTAGKTFSNMDHDPTIVHPGKLSLERQIDVCQRCHLQGLNLLKEGKRFEDFRPGMVLSDYFDIYLPRYKGDQGELDMANHAQRFQMSQCFTNRHDEQDFTCITCHNPHISVQNTQHFTFNKVCGQCHQSDACTELTATRIQVEDNCVQCHMPEVSSSDIAHVSIHDHYIRKPMKAEEASGVRTLIGLYAVNNPDPQRTELIQAYLEYWEKFDKNPFYLNKAAELLTEEAPTELWLKYYYLSEQYSKAIELEEDRPGDWSAWDHLMMGVCYEKNELMSQAVYHYSESYNLDRTSLNGVEKYAYSLIETGKMAKAREVIGASLKEFPRSALLHAYMARLHIMRSNFASGYAELQQANALDPMSLVVWETYFNYYRMRGDRQSMQVWGGKILRQYPDHPDAATFQQEMAVNQ